MKLSVLTYNTLFAGQDGDDDRRMTTQVALIDDLAPDIFLMQEASGFDAGGHARLHAFETRIGMRGFLAVAPRTGQNTAIFIREPLKPISFESDGANFHHALATLTVALPGTERPLTLMSAHLCPNGADIRRREAAHLAVNAGPDRLALPAGDFNSLSPRDPEPADFADLPPHHRSRYLADDLVTADRSVIAKLEAAGWVDVGHRLGASAVPTVPATGFAGTEFATMRCDFVLTTQAMAGGAASYEVVRAPVTDIASDHYPILASFEIAS